MKNLRTVILTLSMLAFVSMPAFAQTKIASVDMPKLFNGYWKTKQSQVLLESRKTELRKEIKDMADGLEKAQVDYKRLLEQANDQAISADEREKRKQTAADSVKDLNSRKVAIEQFQRQAETQLADQSQRMSANLLGEIKKAITDKAKAGSYGLVINSANSPNNEAIVYVSGDNDLTTAVLAQLNAGAPIDVTPTTTTGIPLTISTNLPH